MSPRNATALLLLTVFAVLLLGWMEGSDTPALHVADVPPTDEPSTEEVTTLRVIAEAPQEGPALRPAAQPAATQEPAPRAPVRIRVLGAAGAPLPGVYVTLRPTERGAAMIGKARPTDERGEIVFADVTHDGGHLVEFFRTNPYVNAQNTTWDRLPPLGSGPAVRVITGPELTYRASVGLPWHVSVVSAETGQEISGVRIRHPRARGVGEDAWRSAPHTWLSATHAARPGALAFKIKPPSGWLVWELPTHYGTISPYARSLRCIQPLRREIPLTIAVQEADGAGAEAKVTSLSVAGRGAPTWGWTGDAHGRLHVTGVPFLRDEIVVVALCRKDGTGAKTLRAVVPDHPAGHIELSAVLPETDFEGPENNGTIGIGGGSSSSFRLRRAKYKNHLHVTVLRRDGSPATNASVSIPRKTRRTDAQGRASFESVTPGKVTVSVRQAGLLPLKRVVDVPAAGDVRVELRETAGGAIEIQVVDGEGKPLSFATLSLKTPSGLPWIDMDGTTQRIDPFADHFGRRTLTHIEPGAIEVTARWGSRRVTRKGIAIEDDKGVTIRLVLPRPQPPR